MERKSYNLTEIFYWNFKVLQLHSFKYIYSSLNAFSVLFIQKSLNFGNLSLELHHTPIFQWKSDTPGFLFLYSPRTCLKLEWPVLEMHNLWCRTAIFSWNISVEGSILVQLLCNLKHISLYFIEYSFQITFK